MQKQEPLADPCRVGTKSRALYKFFLHAFNMFENFHDHTFLFILRMHSKEQVFSELFFQVNE